jgi:predicted nucleotidyltransferase
MATRDSESQADLYRDLRAAVRAKIARDLERERAEAEERRARVREALPAALADAREQGLCEAAWLFGSYAWGTPGERSDVDLLVDACPDPEHLAAIVARATGTEVHVIDLRDAPEGLRERALAEGEPL